MANLECPRCRTRFSTSGGWENVAVSSLTMAPAVPDMATQVRCPNCGHLFAHGEIRYLNSSGSKGLIVTLLLLCVGLIALALT
jgi:uncharacterized C2H2 Zn-finger protein